MTLYTIPFAGELSSVTLQCLKFSETVLVDCSDLGLKLQGKLRVTVVRCTGLKNMEKVGISDPYVRLYVRVLFKSKTDVIENNLNPVWNKTFDFDVEDTETQTLVIQVQSFNQVLVLASVQYLCPSISLVVSHVISSFE